MLFQLIYVTDAVSSDEKSNANCVCQFFHYLEINKWENEQLM